MSDYQWTPDSAGLEHFTHYQLEGQEPQAVLYSDLHALAFYLYTTLVWVDQPGDFEARRRDAIKAYETFPWRQSPSLRDAYEAGYCDADSGFEGNFHAWLRGEERGEDA